FVGAAVVTDAVIARQTAATSAAASGVPRQPRLTCFIFSLLDRPLGGRPCFVDGCVPACVLRNSRSWRRLLALLKAVSDTRGWDEGGQPPMSVATGGSAARALW